MDEITFINEVEFDLNEYEILFLKLSSYCKEILNIKYPLSYSVNFIDEQKSLSLNTEYRNKSYIGDVISFPIDDTDELYKQIGFREIGDIFICYSEALKKSKKLNHTINEEMAWLFVHGLLHILGYDHEINMEQEKIMFDLTDRILEKANIEYKIDN